MINLVVIAISAVIVALLVVWWRWPALRPLLEAPKYFMLRQERRFDHADEDAPRSRNAARADDDRRTDTTYATST